MVRYEKAKLILRHHLLKFSVRLPLKASQASCRTWVNNE